MTRRSGEYLLDPNFDLIHQDSGHRLPIDTVERDEARAFELASRVLDPWRPPAAMATTAGVTQ
jgi:hypothetical protein